MSLFNSKKTNMRYNNLGATGLLVSEFSFGCMTFTRGRGTLGKDGGGVDGEDAFEMMRTAYEHGVNFFDNAEVYGGEGAVSEVIMGETIQLGLKRNVWERDDLVISTKIFGGARGKKDKWNLNSVGLSRKHLYEGLRASLKRMQLEYVDLVFCHRPDPRTPIEETVRGMNNLIDRGMAFYWGTSEWTAQQLTEARAIAKELGMVPPAFDQCQYSMIERRKVEVDYLPLYPELGLTVWSPLAGGILTGKYAAGGQGRMSSMANAGQKKGKMTPMERNMAQRFEKVAGILDRLEPIATRLGCSLAQLALAWCAANDNVSTVLLGATKLQQLEENFKALEIIPMITPVVKKEIEKALANAPAQDEAWVQASAMRRGRVMKSRL
jgi:voltage-dependent potassium channel beta subunit